MDYTILIIDDDEPIHYMAKSLLGNEYQLLHAKNAQEAINILSETKVNLILSDIHMPGLTGLELLQSLRVDKEKKHIPVLIMTNLPTVEKEQKALELGASDFIRKDLFNKDPIRVLEIIRMKLVTNVVFDDLGISLEDSKNKLVMGLMDTALLGLFDETVEVLNSELMALLDANFVGTWLLRKNGSTLISLKGDIVPKISEISTLENEPALQHLKQTGTSYFNNHIYNDGISFFKDFAVSKDLPAEVSIPLYSVTEANLISSQMKVPEHAALFAVMIIKRKKLFSQLEFELVSKLVTQAGSILWRLYQTARA